MTVTVKGTASAASYLFLAWHAGNGPCANTAGDEAPDGRVVDQRLIWDSDPVTGPFSRSAPWTVGKNGEYTLCAYLNEDSYYYAAPAARSTLAVSVRAPTVTLAVGLAGNSRPDEPLTVTSTGEVEGHAKYLYVAATSAKDVGCGANAKAAGGTKLTWPDTAGFEGLVGPGPFVHADRWLPPPFTKLRICGFIADQGYDSTPYTTFSSETTTCCAPAVPAVQDTRARFGTTTSLDWPTGYATGATVSVYDENPGQHSTADALVTKTVPDEVHHTTLSRALLEPGTYWWTVQRHAGDWPPVTSPAVRLVVLRPRLSLLSASATVKGLRRTRATVAIRATPYARLTLTVTRNGRRVSANDYVQQPRADSVQPERRTFTINGHCTRPGLYVARVVARDATGRQRTKRLTWRGESCAQIAAWERAAVRQDAGRGSAENHHGTTSLCMTLGRKIDDLVSVSCTRAKTILQLYVTGGDLPRGWSCNSSTRRCNGSGLGIDSYRGFRWR